MVFQFVSIFAPFHRVAVAGFRRQVFQICRPPRLTAPCPAPGRPPAGPDLTARPSTAREAMTPTSQTSEVTPFMRVSLDTLQNSSSALAASMRASW